MSGPNAALTLPPGDRDESPSAASITPESTAPEEPMAAGRKPFEAELRARVAAIVATCETALLACRDLNYALGEGDLVLAQSAALRVNGAFLVDFRVVSRELVRSITNERRERLRAEVHSEERVPCES